VHVVPGHRTINWRGFREWRIWLDNAGACDFDCSLTMLFLRSIARGFGCGGYDLVMRGLAILIVRLLCLFCRSRAVGVPRWAHILCWFPVLVCVCVGGGGGMAGEGKTTHFIKHCQKKLWTSASSGPWLQVVI
jgi:hypothetical protein